MHLPIHRADRLMGGAHRLAAARALLRLVPAHRLLAPALAVREAARAQTPAPLRRARATLLRVPVTHDPAAAAARRETRGAGRVPVFGADPRVGRAVLEPARRADAHVLITRRLLVHATVCNAVVGAEVLGADGAVRRAGLAAAVVVPADHQGRRRAAAVRTREHPGGPATERPLRAAPRPPPLRRLGLPPCPPRPPR